jgi:CBS domain-containing protein
MKALSRIFPPVHKAISGSSLICLWACSYQKETCPVSICQYITHPLSLLFCRCNQTFWIFHAAYATFKMLKQQFSPLDDPMKVSEILKVKGDILYTVTPDTEMSQAVDIMAEKDLGSLVVMEFGELVGMLTFREVMKTLHANKGVIGGEMVRKHMDDHPITITPDTELNEVRRLMLDRHARYVPVMDAKTLLGVISFYDVAKAVLEAQSFENKMLKAYIRDWPADGDE